MQNGHTQKNKRLINDKRCQKITFYLQLTIQLNKKKYRVATILILHTAVIH